MKLNFENTVQLSDFHTGLAEGIPTSLLDALVRLAESMARRGVTRNSKLVAILMIRDAFPGIPFALVTRLVRDVWDVYYVTDVNDGAVPRFGQTHPLPQALIVDLDERLDLNALSA